MPGDIEILQAKIVEFADRIKRADDQDADREKRLKAVEDQIKEFLLKVNILLWLGGGIVVVLTALGISSPSVVNYLVKRAYAESEQRLRDNVASDLSAATKADADLQKRIAEAASVAVVSVGARPPTGTAKSGGPTPSGPPKRSSHENSAPLKTRAERQISMFSSYLSQPIQGIYSETDLTSDVGQLVNSVTIFIDDMQDRQLSPDYGDADAKIYIDLHRLSADVQHRVNVHDDPAHDSGADWHRRGWFEQFDQQLNFMENAHRQVHTFEHDDLEKWSTEFEKVRGGLWGDGFSGPWPQPLTN